MSVAPYPCSKLYPHPVAWRLTSQRRSHTARVLDRVRTTSTATFKQQVPRPILFPVPQRGIRQGGSETINKCWVTSTLCLRCVWVGSHFPDPPFGGQWIVAVFARSVLYGACAGFTLISTTYASKHHNINDCSAAHVVVSVVSSDMLHCRLLKWLLDHPMDEPRRAALHCCQGQESKTQQRSKQEQQTRNKQITWTLNYY